MLRRCAPLMRAGYAPACAMVLPQCAAQLSSPSLRVELEWGKVLTVTDVATRSPAPPSIQTKVGPHLLPAVLGLSHAAAVHAIVAGWPGHLASLQVKSAQSPHLCRPLPH